MKLTTLGIFCFAALIFGCQNKTVETTSQKAEAVKKEIAPKVKNAAVKPEPGKQAASKKVDTVAKKQVFPENMKNGETLHFGAPLTMKEEAITLTAAISKGGSKDPMKISGKIATVCKAKGCWFTLQHDKSPEVRVKMKDYGFFVPKNADGGKATVEGILSKRIVPKAEAQHYADDAVKAGEKAKVVKSDEEVFELIVSGVEITKPS